MVDLEDVEVDVVEPVALGDRAREAVRGELPALDEDLLGRAAGGARRLDRGLDLLGGRELELEHHVGQEARPRVAAARVRDAVPGLVRLRRRRRGGRGRAEVRPARDGAQVRRVGLAVPDAHERPGA